MNLGDCPTIEGTNQTKDVYDSIFLVCIQIGEVLYLTLLKAKIVATLLKAKIVAEIIFRIGISSNLANNYKKSHMRFTCPNKFSVVRPATSNSRSQYFIIRVHLKK